MCSIKICSHLKCEKSKCHKHNMLNFFTSGILYYRKKSLATPDCFAPYLVNVATQEYCCICLETGLISEEFCVKILVVVAAAEE